MVASAQPKKRIKVTFPQPVFDQLVADVPPRKRSAFIVAATEEAMRRKLLELEAGFTSGSGYGRDPATQGAGRRQPYSHAEVWGE